MMKQHRSTRDYDIGYGKPPEHKRFKPGQSGNPNGRPRGSKNLKTDLQEELAERIIVSVAGMSKPITKQRALVKALMATALKGDVRAASKLFDLAFQFLGSTEKDREPEDLDAEDKRILDLFSVRQRKRDPSRGTSDPEGKE
jgi:Family of unknown function (DUF5681)